MLLLVRLNRKSIFTRKGILVSHRSVCRYFPKHSPPEVLHFSTGSLCIVYHEPLGKYRLKKSNPCYIAWVTRLHRFYMTLSISDAPKHPVMLRLIIFIILDRVKFSRGLFHGCTDFQFKFELPWRNLPSLRLICHHRVAPALLHTVPQAGRCVRPCHDKRAVITQLCAQPPQIPSNQDPTGKLIQDGNVLSTQDTAQWKQITPVITICWQWFCSVFLEFKTNKGKSDVEGSGVAKGTHKSQTLTVSETYCKET